MIEVIGSEMMVLGQTHGGGGGEKQPRSGCALAIDSTGIVHRRSGVRGLEESKVT